MNDQNFEIMKAHLAPVSELLLIKAVLKFDARRFHKRKPPAKSLLILTDAMPFGDRAERVARGAREQRLELWRED